VTSYNSTPERSGRGSGFGVGVISGIVMTVSVKLGLGLAAWMRGVGLGEGVRVGGTGVSVETRGVTASPPQAEVINKIVPQIKIVLIISIL
jgi:hypothetical protein